MWSMDLCAITVIEFRGGQPVMRAHNLTGHLSTLLDEEAVAAQEAAQPERGPLAFAASWPRRRAVSCACAVRGSPRA